MDINELLGKAFNISQDIKFITIVYDKNGFSTESEMTYFELGSKLITEANNIKRIKIYLFR